MNKTLISSALALPPNERVEFAELIFASIDYEEDVLHALLSEVNDRIKAVEEGKSRLLDFESIYREG